MTPAERDDPKIIDGSRRARIARGSGVEVSAVNNLVNKFFEARKMMSQLASGKGMPGLPGMPGMGGQAKRPAAKQGKKNKKGKKVSGNPAKRAAAKSGQPEQTADPAAAFGGDVDPAQLEQAIKDFQLPPGLGKMINNQGK